MILLGKETDVSPGAVLIDRILFLEPGVPRDQWINAYENILRPVPPGTYELIVHLAYADEEMKAATRERDTWGAAWRQSDFACFTSSEFRQLLREQNIRLITWRELARGVDR